MRNGWKGRWLAGDLREHMEVLCDLKRTWLDLHSSVRNCSKWDRLVVLTSELADMEA